MRGSRRKESADAEDRYVSMLEARDGLPFDQIRVRESRILTQQPRHAGGLCDKTSLGIGSYCS